MAKFEIDVTLNPTMPELRAALGFLGDLLLDYTEGNHMDIDGCGVQDLLADHGLTFECKATEADCEEDWAREWGYEPGDTMFKYGPLMLRLMKQARDRAAEKRNKVCPRTS